MISSPSSEIILKKNRIDSLLRRHPWVFSGAIHSDVRSIPEGALVTVYDPSKTTCLGVGFFQHGSIAVRMLSNDLRPIDLDFWTERIQNAATFRAQILNLPNPDTDAYRLIHGEGDGLPGLIIDIYGPVAVIQCHAVGYMLHLDFISTALATVLGSSLRSIYLKSKDTVPQYKGPHPTEGLLWGESLDHVDISENGIKFRVDFIHGQKTGFFLDQRENRNLLLRHSKNRSVLNCFCYTGGFSLYAGAAGATKVVSVDISQRAMDTVIENIELNQQSNIHECQTANVMEYLKDADIPQYDIVIVDPPAFAKSMAKRHNAVQAYKRLNILALEKVKPGGLLFTYSCSQVVGTQLFYDTIVAAGIEANRKVRVIQQLSQGGDHPINLFHPEGHYLKGLMLYVE